jgi:hypothetical protein
MKTQENCAPRASSIVLQLSRSGSIVEQDAA